jgi:transcriptional regulator with XRE-family HTH domain
MQYEMTLEEIAQQLGVTRQAVNVTERRALLKARALFERRGIDEAMALEILQLAACRSASTLARFESR